MKLGAVFSDPRIIATLRGRNLSDGVLELLHAVVQLAQRLQQRFQAVGSQMHLLDQLRRMPASQHQSPPGRFPQAIPLSLVDRQSVVVTVRSEQSCQRDQVGSQPCQQLFLAGRVGDRYLDCPIQSQLAVSHVLQHPDRLLNQEVVGQQRFSEAGATGINPAGNTDFIRPGKQGNLAHLCQVHTDRIIRRLARLAFAGSARFRLGLFPVAFERALCRLQAATVAGIMLSLDSTGHRAHSVSRIAISAGTHTGTWDTGFNRSSLSASSRKIPEQIF